MQLHAACSCTLALCVLIAPTIAQTPASPAEIPAAAVPDPIVVDLPSFQHAAASNRVVLPDLLLADGATATVDLSRFEVFARGATIVTNTTAGEVLMPAPPLVLFAGAIRGEPESLAYLAFAPEFTYGFLRSGGRVYSISTGRAGQMLPALLSDLRRFTFDPADVACHADSLAPMPVMSRQPGAAENAVERGALPCRILDMAVETDNEFTNSLFGGNETTAAAYAGTLMGAVSAIYTRDINTRIRITYLRLWSQAADPWDQDGGTGAQLVQFRDYWAANMRHVHRNLAHFLSGRGLGGGVAWLSVICNDDYGFGLSANLGGAFPYPLQDHSSANWDVMVTAHEIGHNVGAPHTHDHSPVIDGCGSDPQDCTLASQGTIMSYCHICGGGMANIVLQLHPRTISEAILPYLNGTCALTGAPTDGVALNFDGVDDRATIAGFGSIAPTTEVTIEFWQYADAVVPQSTFGLSTDTLTNRLQAHVPWSDGRVYWDFGNINTGGRLIYNPPTTVAGRWTHWALVATQSGNAMRIYRDGAQVASKTGMRPFTRNSTDLLLGSLSGGNFFNGRIRDFRVWSVARSAAQIAANFNGTLTGSEPGLIVYLRCDEGAGAAAIDIAPVGGANNAALDAPSWVSIDDCADDLGACCYLDGACVIATAEQCAAYGGHFVASGTDCADCPAVGACCLPGVAGGCSVIFADDCLAGGGTFHGAGSDCSNIGPLDGAAVSLHGAAGYVDFGTSSAFNLTSNFTLEAWVRPSPATGIQRVFSRGTPGVNGYAFGLNGRKLRFTAFGRLDYETLGDYVNPDVWTHVAVAFDASADANFYVNGVLVETRIGSLAVLPTTSRLLAGRNPAGATEPFVGQFDELRVWSIRRASADILADYARNVSGTTPGLAGYWRLDDGVGLQAEDHTTNNRDGTLVGSVEWVAIASCNPPCPGDIDGDRDADLSDLARLLARFGITAGALRADGDLDGDGDVDLSDLSLLLAQFGGACP